MSCASEGTEITLLCIWLWFWPIAIRLWGALSFTFMYLFYPHVWRLWVPSKLKIAWARGGWVFGKALQLGQGTFIALYCSRACDTLLSTQLSAGSIKLCGLLLLSPCGPLFTWCKVEQIQLEGCKRPSSSCIWAVRAVLICALKSYWTDKAFAKDTQFWLLIKRQDSFFYCLSLVWKIYFIAYLQKYLVE